MFTANITHQDFMPMMANAGMVTRSVFLSLFDFFGDVNGYWQDMRCSCVGLA
jgi:hypothetical protein